MNKSILQQSKYVIHREENEFLEIIERFPFIQSLTHFSHRVTGKSRRRLVARRGTIQGGTLKLRCLNISKTEQNEKKCFRRKLQGFKGDVFSCCRFDHRMEGQGEIKGNYVFLNRILTFQTPEFVALLMTNSLTTHNQLLEITTCIIGRRKIKDGYERLNINGHRMLTFGPESSLTH